MTYVNAMMHFSQEVCNMNILHFWLPGVWPRLFSFIGPDRVLAKRHRLSVMLMAIIVPALFIQFGLSSPVTAKTMQRCHMCGMDASKSQTEFVVSLDDGSQEHTCCLHCVFLLQKFMKDRRMVKLETRDFSSGALIDAKQAFYLEGASLIPKGSMAPFILAFKEKESAEKFRLKHGGTVVNLDRAMEIVARFDKDVGPIK
jgi:hypothetical protein